MMVLLWKITETADRVVDPSVESREARVDAGQVGTAASDAETYDAHLKPLAVLFTNQRTTSISLSLKKLFKLSLSLISCLRKTYIAGVPSFCAGADGCGRQYKIGTKLGP